MDIILSLNTDTEKQLPQSVRSALINQKDCIDQCDEDIAALGFAITDIEAKIAIAKEIGMPEKGFKNILTRRTKERLSIEKAKQAYQAGFMEIPELGGGTEVRTDDPNGDKAFWKAVLPIDAPLRVYQDLKAAKESGLFDDIVIYRPSSANKRDPIIAGRVGGRVFLIANWR